MKSKQTKHIRHIIVILVILLVFILAPAASAISGRTVKGRVYYADNQTQGLEGAVVSINTVPFTKECFQENKQDFCCKCSTDEITHKHRLTWDGGGYNILTNNLMFDKACPILNVSAGDDCDGMITDTSRVWIEVDTPLEHLSSPIGDAYTFGVYYKEAPIYANVIDIELKYPKPAYREFIQETPELKQDFTAIGVITFILIILLIMLWLLSRRKK